jgi:hypothetical protein
MRKHSLLGISVMIGTLLFGLVQPVSAATDTHARDSFNTMAQDMLEWLEDNPTDLSDPAYSYSYQTMLSAKYYGWSDSRTQVALQKVYAQKKADGGYGKAIAWDANQDGSVNPASTSYTVTTTDHVGRTLLAGWKDGFVPISYVIGTVDSLLATPVENTPNGYCMAYSRAVADKVSNVGCVVNVSLGAAAYLQSVLNAGVLNGDAARTASVTAVIAKLKPLGLATYDETRGGWSYHYRPDGAPSKNEIQDWNHNAFTFESAITLYGQSSMNAGIANALRKPIFESKGTAVGLGAGGRVRLQFFAPNVYPENTWRDASYTQTTISVRTAAAQLGLWAMRLGSNATGQMMDWRKTDSISTVNSYNASGQLDSNVPDNSTIVLRSTILSANATPNVFQNVHLQSKPASSGSYLTIQQKTTGSVGNIAFATPITENTCYRFVVVGAYTTTGIDKASNNICVTVY